MANEKETAVRKRTVLVVEDNEMNREILCEILSDEYDTIEAENGQVGLDLLREHSGEIALVMLDVYMPVCDGFGFLEQKRQDSRLDSVPVIMMTASNTVDDEIRCLQLGATDFITKPYNAEVMKNRMKSVVRLRESAAMLGRLERDGLTGLYSKEFFYHNVRELLSSNREARYDIVCSDIVNFRAMNERYGQEQCDEYLRHLAKVIPETLPGLVLGGRIGADVFAFLVEHQEGAEWTLKLYETDQDEQAPTFAIKYGVISDVDHETPVSAICDRATLALNRIKGRFNVTVAWYDDEMRQMQMREHQIIEGMHKALDNREFQIYYQPKHHLRFDKTGGAEALVRWIHPELGFISPGMFIPLFERNGFITQLDFYIWEEVCRELHHCVESGIPIVPVSINVSRMDFDVPDLADRIAALADKYEVEHSKLHIELTESIYSDSPERIAKTLQSLHDKGFIIELDDFGAGYSDLASLNTLTLDVMKLDMSIVRQATAADDYSIPRFVIQLAECLHMKTVAEGVETADQVSALKVLGCTYIQGYYFSKPLPRGDFEKYLVEHGVV